LGVKFLDRLTSSLDPTQVQHIRDPIRSLAQQATVIVSTHVLQEPQLVGRRADLLRRLPGRYAVRPIWKSS
jgi:ABC-2 type transport system ATP-binding protein